jgi:aryl-alcohol dehydrogenase-like predicted oxidoreductase
MIEAGLLEAVIIFTEVVCGKVAVHPVAVLQTEYSLWTRDIEAEILPMVKKLDIGLSNLPLLNQLAETVHAVLNGRGLADAMKVKQIDLRFIRSPCCRQNILYGPGILKRRSCRW